MLKRLLPFLDWFRGYSLSGFRADVVSGVTVALVLIPQSMAYAQLAGLPPHYGLYASFLPPLVAALFGSSRQLATGPVAVVSLMTAATLETLATAGCEGYIAYAILLSLLVGLFQLALGVLRLGIVVNFLSHPVVNGFTNAAALIIATSQLSKLFGVHVEKAEHHYETVVRVVSSAIHYTHLPTLLLAVLSFAIMIGLKKVSRKIPYVLAAVVVTTVISFFSGFEHRESAPLESIRSEKVHRLVREFNGHLTEIDVMSEERGNLSTALKEIEEQSGTRSTAWVRVHSDLEVQSLQWN
jgi:sulfate permease, SulP family